MQCIRYSVTAPLPVITTKLLGTIDTSYLTVLHVCYNKYVYLTLLQDIHKVNFVHIYLYGLNTDIKSQNAYFILLDNYFTFIASISFLL